MSANTIETPYEFGKVDVAAISELVGRLGFELPEDYKNFLLENNGGYPVNSILNLPNGKMLQVAYFLGIGMKDEYKSVEKSYIRMKGRIPKALLPIGVNFGGDYYCLGISGERTGKVYIWRHDFEAEDDGSNFYGNVTEIAQSFDDFFNSLTSDE